MTKNKWSLYKWTAENGYPCKWYFWVNEYGIIKFMRSIESVGFMPVQLPFDVSTGQNINQMRLSKHNIRKVYNHRMNDAQLSQGWLILDSWTDCSIIYLFRSNEYVKTNYKYKSISRY